MNIERKLFDAKGVRERAAVIRAGWSELDRLTRTGLPPDIPRKLERQLLLLHTLERQKVSARRTRRRQILAAVSSN
jgi:hypothetical protein